MGRYDIEVAQGTAGPHVHRSDASGGQDEFDHRASYHVHEHEHAPLVHAHELAAEAELAEHAKSAHIHDHVAPVSGRRE